MRRFLVFALLGPLIGACVFAQLVAPLGGYLRAGELPNISNFIVGPIVAAPFGYLLGIIPSLAAAIIDWIFSRFSWGVVVTGVFGFLVSIAFIPPFQKIAEAYPWFPLFTGLIGGVPAVVCSRLSRKTN